MIRISRIILLLLSAPLFLLACNQQKSVSIEQIIMQTPVKEKIQPGAHDIESYIHLLKGKKVGILVNQTSMIDHTHLLDSLLELGITVSKIFTPEHGFRGKADAGEQVNNEIDVKTGIPIISLYGSHKKPTPDDLKNIDIVLFDLQDVGVRFYTYISTLHYIMEACSEANLPVVLLDRPNPNGFYVAGPVLDPTFKSFVGMHPVPIVYGLSIGEYGMMINGESWLKDGLQCDLTVIKCKNYDHTMSYDLPIKPSPNLPNQRSILLYPSLCLFEGTVASIGRGTDKQFQIIGHPRYNNNSNFSFTPIPKSGAKYPKLQDKLCFGIDLSTTDIKSLISNPSFNIEYLVEWYSQLNPNTSFWLKNHFIDKLAGTDQLRLMIEHGLKPNQIEKSWEDDLNDYRKKRKKYLLYADFN